MDYQEIDIGDDGPDGVVTPRVYLVPDDDGISLMYRGLDDPEREIFLSTAEVQRFAAAAGYVPAAEVDVEKAMRVEREGLLACERERFAVAYDAAQKMMRERDEARQELAEERATVANCREEVEHLHQALRQVLGLSNIAEARIILRAALPSGEKEGQQ